MELIAKWSLALFFFAFATVHGGWEQDPAPAAVPGVWAQRPGDSWILGRAGLSNAFAPVAQLLWGLGLIGFVAAGCAVLGWAVPHDWWRPLAVGAASVSLLRAVLYWHPRQAVSALVDVVIIVTLLFARWPQMVAG